MLRLGAFLVLVVGVFSLLCPYVDPDKSPYVQQFTNGGDGSCYSEIQGAFISRSTVYVSCADFNSYLPFVMNAFQNTALQQKTVQAPCWGGLQGMWMGLTCNGNTITSCTWDDGTKMTSNSYSNFDRGFPNATIGPCVYQNTTTGMWRSQSCSRVLRLNLGYFCKFTPTNNGSIIYCISNGYSSKNLSATRPGSFQTWSRSGAPRPNLNSRAPMCSPINITKSWSSYLSSCDYFDGHCYNTDYSADTIDARRICTGGCGSTFSIHSEGENSFIRDLLFVASTHYGAPDGGKIEYLGIKVGDTQWFDGTAIDYTNYVTPPASPGYCVYMSIDSSNQSTFGHWYTTNCTSMYYNFLICKKQLVNDCDTPYVPFPMYSPPFCNGSQYLKKRGAVYSPGYPYYPYGEQPNYCEYIQNVEEGLYPRMDITIADRGHFFSIDNISTFEFYASDGPNEKPFYIYPGYPDSTLSFDSFTVTSPTNTLRAVYTTLGDPDILSDWDSIVYAPIQKLSCSLIIDYSYLGYYNQSAFDVYYNGEEQMTDSLLWNIPDRYEYGGDCKLDFYWNYAAYGNVANSASILTPANYSNHQFFTQFANSTGDDYVDLCSFINQLNDYQIPVGTENSCLIFFSGRSAQDFAACNPVNTQKFKYTFGVAINGQTGVSTFTSNISPMIDFSDDEKIALCDMITKAIRPTFCNY